MKINVVDLGNNNIKVVNNDGKESLFKSIVSYDFESYPDAFNYVNYEGKYVYFEKGKFNLEYKKTKKDFISQILYALATVNIDEDSKEGEEINIETNLTLLLPIDEMMNKKEYIEQLKNKEFKYTAKYKKKRNIKLKIKDVLVLPEGYISYMALDDEEKDKSILIIDIGGRTTNIAAIDSGKPKELRTIKIGMLDFYSRVLAQYNDIDCKLEDVERLIDEGKIEVKQSDYGRFINDVINSIKIYVKINHYELVKFTGGASLRLKDIIEEELPENCEVIDDAIKSNIKGSMIASKEVWKEDISNE